MRIAVVTPYSGEALDVLRRCHDSVAGQTLACTHYVVADGPARSEIDEWPVQHVRLAGPHRDGYGTARTAGAMSALNQGFDAFAYLDPDDTFDPRHLEVLAGVMVKASSPVVLANCVTLDAQGAPIDGPPSRFSISGLFHTTAAARIIPFWAMRGRTFAESEGELLLVTLKGYGLTYVGSRRPTVTVRPRSSPDAPPPVDDRPVNLGQGLSVRVVRKP